MFQVENSDMNLLHRHVVVIINDRTSPNSKSSDLRGYKGHKTEEASQTPVSGGNHLMNCIALEVLGVRLYFSTSISESLEWFVFTPSSTLCGLS